MRNTRIYTAQPLSGNILIDLEREPSRHIARVLRLRPGDDLILFDGLGGEYQATLVAVDKHIVKVQTASHQATDTEASLDIHLGIAVSRGERMDWVVQKCTELGVCTISPLTTERSGVKLAGERADKKIRHWQQIAISACEQCGRNLLPTVAPLQTLQNWIMTTDAEQKLVLHHRANTQRPDAIPPTSIALLVGPEGGLSAQEILTAEQAGYTSWRLGPRILRTETAPLAAISILQSKWGDMNFEDG